MSIKDKYLNYKKKYLELKSQIGGTRENIVLLLNNMSEYQNVKSPSIPIGYQPPQESDAITWGVVIDNKLYGYALTKDFGQLLNGQKQLLVKNVTAYPLLSNVGFSLLNSIMNYGRANNYGYLVIEPSTYINPSPYNDKYKINNYILYKL